ncbi:uncharacterized protein L969DRAFT_18972 [Mixia osmundae IAM 14324]|uniref:uncharacterized protein n=1 Tax=Mixia osmundae (strain CBS 9802 / IAM 14324 / JCM 22182 / KY 12970) TaxID=764103 RepID=UPI0004A55470|nr:uncharacterized protein L969DRAFT_18972 [Mixia osmundae IAM 14324]KEI37489.1 hypothetical protein L969DRAFT_18972 [Mixia osmundae IAM 14324]
MTLPAPRALDLSSFDDVPLFMRDLPASEAEKPSNTTLDALQTLLYDGTPDEIAQNLKSQGNEYYNGRRYKEALGFYTQAIDETGKEIAPQVKRALLSNRSACHLELENV